MSCLILSQILEQEQDLVHHAHRPPAEVSRGGGARPQGKPAPRNSPGGLRASSETPATVSSSNFLMCNFTLGGIDQLIIGQY